MELNPGAGVEWGLLSHCLDDAEKDNRTDQTCDEAEDPSSAFHIQTEETEQEATNKATHDADYNVEHDSLLGVGALDL